MSHHKSYAYLTFELNLCSQPKDFSGLKKCVEVNVLKRFHSMDNPTDIFDEELLSFYVRQVCRNRLRQNHNRPRPVEILDSSDDDDDEDDPMQVEAMGPGPLPCSPS